MKEQLVQALTSAVKEQFGVDVTPEFSRPEPQFGDYATNVAMQVAGKADNPPAGGPREVAEALAVTLRGVQGVKEVTIAGPGFINLRLEDHVLSDMWSLDVPQKFAGQTVVAEYSDPNPFKVLHAGHLYTTLVGDAISRLIAAAGANVHRVNFGGDVGLHVAKCMWGILRNLGGTNIEKLGAINEADRAKWMSQCYVVGNEAYETANNLTDIDEIRRGGLNAKTEILSLNKILYLIAAGNDNPDIAVETPQSFGGTLDNKNLAKIYWICRQWSYDYFEVLYNELGVEPFEKYYPESITTPTGVETVMRELDNGVYERSDGAVVFRGEPYGLHTRVFINQQGLPTYEAKDVGLIIQKWRDYQFDLSFIITGNDIVEYMKVVQKSIEQFEPELVARSKHLTHGNLKLAGGKKMSSRKGTVLLALDVLEAAELANTQVNGQKNTDVSLGAVKYALLKQRVGGDIVYDPEESVSLVGNSGPYLQYAHARACSILTKTGEQQAVAGVSYDEHERALALKLSQFTETLEAALVELMPHGVCTYLYELAQVFNRFYEYSRVIGDERQALRVELVRRYRDTLAHGLELLGISAPERL